MARGILEEYGPESAPGGNRAECGGVLPKDKRDVMNYQPPQGPIGIGHNSPGLGGANYGNSGTQGTYGTPPSGGSPGLHGENLGNKGTQGRR